MITPEEYREQLAAIQATFAVKSLAEQMRDLMQIVLQLRPYERSIDTETSITWLQSAANKAICTTIHAALTEQLDDPQGNTLYVKGWLLHYGIGADEDRPHAAALWETAAERGHSEAQYELGKSYTTYDAGASDLVKAVRWLTAASEQGHPQAKVKLDRTTVCLQNDQRQMLKMITDATADDDHDQHAAIQTILTGFLELHYINPITMYSDNRRSKFIATLYRAMTQYQDEDGITAPSHHPAIFEELKESNAFSPIRNKREQATAYEWARRLQQDDTLVYDVNEITLGYLGVPRETATELLAPAAFKFSYWHPSPKKTVSAAEGNHYSFRIKFTTKDSRDDFFHNEHNQNLFEHLRREEPHLVIDSTIGNRFTNGYSITLTYPKNASEGFNQTLAELKLNLMPPAPSHAARLEARRPSSSSLNR